MRYEDVRHLRGLEGYWFRLKCRLARSSRQPKPAVTNLSHLSDHERRDIGLPDEIRYMDWRALRRNGGL